MIIYDRNGVELIDAPVTSSAVRKRVLMGDNYVSLPFSHDTYIDFAPGAYIIYKGLKFEIIDVDKNRPTRNATTGGWDYTLQFDDQERHMTRAIVFWLSQKPREAVFHDTTDLQSFGNLIVENMNAFVPAKNWKMRDLSDELKEGTKLVSFNGDTCWNAVNTIAETFDVEWWTEQSEGYIYLCFGKLEIGTEEDFVEGEVITSIPSRKGDDSNYGTRFYVFGSTRNLTEDYGQADQGGTTNHVSEIRLRLPGGQEYIDARPDMAWNDVVEKFVVFEDIYPKNTDTVTSVEKVKRQTDSGTEYEARVIYAKDTPFLPTDLIPGETLQAVITSGALSGRTFDIQLGAAFDDPDAWNPETNPFDRKFEIVADVETTGEQEIIIPNDNLDIEPGDTFVLTGVKLPGARIGEAEQELLEAGTTWAQKNSKDTSIYDCPTNPVYCQQNDKSYELGQKVRLVNEPQFGSSGRSSRIQGYEKSLDNEYQATYTVGDNTAYSRLGEIEKDIQEAAYAERIGVTNGVGIYLIRAKYDQTQPTDYNAYSAAATDEKLLSRKKNDTAEGIITFAKGILANTLSSEKFVSGNEGKGHSTWIDNEGVSHTEVDQVKARKTVVSKQIAAEEGNVTELTSTNIETTVLTVLDKIIAKDQTLSGKISSAEFLSGLLGYGWMIDTQGNGELHSLSIRSFLEVPELRYNQVQVVGDELWVTAGGVISDVQAADSGRYTITLKLEDGQTNPFAADDILKGIYHVSTGFSTIQMRVDSVAEDGTMIVTPRTPDLVPQKFMNIAKTGNFTNAARQRSILISSKQGRIQFMADVNDWEIAPSMVRMILGDTSGFVHPSFGDTSGYNAFLENILMTGRIFQKSADGTTTKPVAVNKGEWEAGTYYYYDEVTHKGSLWLCTADSTSEEPSASSIGWVEEVASGAGSPGPAGPALRSRGVWSASETYINGGEFRDWVLYGEHNYRYVVKEGIATVPAGTLPTDTAYWTSFNEMEPVATRVLLADNAWIDILSTNGIRIGENGWELTNGEIRHKTSGLKLTKDGKLVAPDGLSLVVGEESINDYTQQKIDSVEIGTVNLIDKSEEIVLIAGANQTHAYVQKQLHVRPNDEFALSIENIEILAGNPTEFTVLIMNQNMSKELCRRILTLDNRTAVFEISADTEEQDGYILFYAGKAGQTNNNSVTYHEVMLVKGNHPALTWSPSLNDQKKQTQEQIDSIRVGSDNLMDGTQQPDPKDTTVWNSTTGVSIWGDVGEFRAMKVWGQWGRLWQSIAEGFIGGQQYRFSCWVKRDPSQETTETKAQLYISKDATTIVSATLDGVKLGTGGTAGHWAGKSIIDIAISADTFQRLECIFEPDETVDGNGFRLEFYTSNYQTNTPCGVVYGYYLVKGNKATDDWRPSLKDTQSYTDKAVNNSIPATRNLALKTEGQLDFRVGSYTGYKFSLVEQPVIGQEYVLSWDDLDFSGTTTVLFRLYSTSGEKSINIKYTKSKGPGSALLTIPQDADLSVQYDLYITGSDATFASGYVTNPMWAKGNKATSWVPAIEDTKEAIAAAQTAADQAKEDAAASAQKLEDWSSDELISPPEKPGLVQQKADIESEYGEIGSQTDRYGLKSSTYWTAYNSAYTLAIQALTKYTASTPESIPVESDYDYIAAYYPKRQIMLDQIAAAAQAYTDGIQFGSVNLIDGSEELTVTASSDETHRFQSFPLHIRPGDEFALSIKSIEILAGTPEGFSLNIVDSTYNNTLASGNLTLDNRTAVYKISENVMEQDGWLLAYAGKWGKTNGVSVTYHEVMLVKGNRPALTWSPSLNDQKTQTQEQIDSIQVGGVNILNGTKNFSDHWSGEGQILSEQYLGLNVVYCKAPTSASYTEVRHQVHVPFTPSEEYTLSFWAKGTGYVHTYCYPSVNQKIIATNGDASIGSAVDTRMRYALTSEWKRFFVTFLTLGTVSPNGDNRVLFRIHSGNNEVYLCGAKLEQGNKATAYSISENDQKDYADQAVNDSIPATRNLALKTEGQLDFDTSSWAGLYLDLAEQPVIGQQYVLSWDDIQFTETSYPTLFLWINSWTGAFRLKEVTQTGSGSVVVTIPDTLLTNKTYRILFGGSDGAMTGYVKNPMWSKGNKVMPWTPAIEDAPNEIREEAKATGIYLEEKKIDVVADRFRITSTAGREIMGADADGNRVSMENLDVQAGATIGPVEVTETGLAVKAEDVDLQTVISNQEFGSLSDALSAGKTSIVALTAPSVSQPGGQFDMGTFTMNNSMPQILTVSGTMSIAGMYNSASAGARIYLMKQTGNTWINTGVELFSTATSTNRTVSFKKAVTIASTGNYKISCETFIMNGTMNFSALSGTLKSQTKRLEVRPSAIFGSLSAEQYFLFGREKPSASGSEIFRAKIQNENGGLEITSTGVNVDGETYVDGQTTIKGNTSVVGKFSVTGEINATGNIQSDTDIEAVRDILIGRYLKGLAISSEKIPSSMTSGSNYQIADSVTCIDAMNTNAINITLPKNPKTGQVILIRQYSAGYTLKGGGRQMHRAGSTVSEFWNDAYASLMWIRFDGVYWAVNYMPSL